MGFIQHLFSNDKRLSNAIKNICGFYPNKINYYRLAFTYSSQYAQKKGDRDNYERLEFLGDSVLATVISDFLYKRYPTKDEGFLSLMRSRIVSKESLAAISVKIGLEQLLNIKLENNRNQKSIREDLFEALIGAIYLDKGYNEAKHFLIQRVIKYFIDFETLENTDTDYKSQFIRLSQKLKFDFQLAVVNDDLDKDMNKVYSVDLIVNGNKVGVGTSFSKKKAEQIACQQALQNDYVLELINANN